MGNKKPGTLSYIGLLVVYKRFEISNFDLLKDVADIAAFITKQYVTL